MTQTKPRVYFKSQPVVVVPYLWLANNSSMKQPQAMGDRIQQRMRALGLRNVDLSAAFGVTEQAVGSKWLRHGKVAKEHLPGLAELLKTTTDWLLTGVGNPEVDGDQREWLEIIGRLTTTQKQVLKDAMRALAARNAGDEK